MATKLASTSALSAQTPHTSGLYADMTLDGPEIGTLVLIVDRAKNLPNRKTMGKQNPYCAARLGKEAKKTETDRRGGQTPRWDQELRFIVHDSPDYNRMKISVFSEDKRTDLVGEAWVELTDVIIPGGGKRDLWQELSFKGKYAGELRVELTYYDERPRPAEPIISQELPQSAGDDARVKRRPLPGNPASGPLTPDSIPQAAAPGRAKHGPRDFRTPPRANSLPPDINHSHPHGAFSRSDSDGSYTGFSSSAVYQRAHDQNPGPFDQPRDVATGRSGSYMQPQQTPDFLPQLPPSNRQRNSRPPRPEVDTRQTYRPHMLQGQQTTSPLALQHSASPKIAADGYHLPHSYDDGYQLHTNYPDPIPDIEHQHEQLDGRSKYTSPPSGQRTGPMIAHEGHEYSEEDHAQPPPPPVHSNSSPAIPQRSTGGYTSPMPAYAATPSNARPHYIPDSSPLQALERKYDTPPRSPMQNSPISPLATTGATPSPPPRTYDGTPPTRVPGQTPSPFSRQQAAPRMLSAQPGLSDPYHNTPSRPHPLSQEMCSHSPQPYSPPPDQFGSSPLSNNPQYGPEYRSRDGVALIRPRPVSPQAPSSLPQPQSLPRSKSAYDIQFPVRSFESADNSPLSSSQRGRPSLPPSTHATPIRKSLSPRPTPPSGAGGMPYSPDSFNVHNPNAQESMLSNDNSPHSPYQIRPGSEAAPQMEANGPIVDWHGKEVDPSDRLPVHSWAPEPEKKTPPARTYGLGRDRDFGPRQNAASSAGKPLSRDTVVNVRLRSQISAPPDAASTGSTALRNRLQKKLTPSKSPAVQQPHPLQERPNYNSASVPNLHEQPLYTAPPYEPRGYRGSYAEMSEDALSREISSIDIGSGSRHVRGGSVPAPTAFVPVRSHKDRRSFY